MKTHLLLSVFGMALVVLLDAKEPQDEAASGRTMRGSEISKRTEACFPAEPRDLFWKMDQVASGEGGALQPIDFDLNGDGVIDNGERDGIRGRNTWLLWGGGNEAFWGWLQEQGYGLTDFLVLIDSRRRASRFKSAGLINQPGFRSVSNPAERILGLWIDLPDASDPAAVILRPPAFDAGYAETADAFGRPVTPPVTYAAKPTHHPSLFEPGEPTLYHEVIARLPKDGIDPDVYGYPSGVFGLRLMPNPDFFGKSDGAKQARAYWKERVIERGDSYYVEGATHSDPRLIRPFRVSMSCGFCHVGPHPLRPPADPENPGWENLSSFIGNQYWDPQPAFGNLLKRDNFLHHFLRSQLPGTVDTSLVSTDHINNANTINAVFDVPARLQRALTNATERQSEANLLIPSIEDGPGVRDRHFPRVLVDGADSCGAFSAFIRVPLNIGTFPELWARSHNPIIGFHPQRPFSVDVSQRNSVFWRVNERERVPYMAKFFTASKPATSRGSGRQIATAPMKLRDARDPDGRPSAAAAASLAAHTPLQRLRGRQVWTENCAICHSSKQPPEFQVAFGRDEEIGDWEAVPAPTTGQPYRLPSRYQNWPAFTRSPAYREYQVRLRKLIESTAGDHPADVDPMIDDHPFWKDNFLSSEIRIPITLVGTNSARSMATNAMSGQVWDNFSSDTYKSLPSVGSIDFFNPFSKTPVDDFGNNDTYRDGREKGGPGYYRPATHISLWAQAPFLHNNSLGLYNGDPSVAGRLASFEDGIRKLLWKDRRSRFDPAHPLPGDLRGIAGLSAAANDPGYIYRVPMETRIEFGPRFIRPLLEGVIGQGGFSLLATWVWVVLAILLGVGIFKGKARHAGILVIFTGVLLAAAIALTASGDPRAALMMAAATGSLALLSPFPGLLVSLALVGAGAFLVLGRQALLPRIARGLFIALTAAVLVGGIKAHLFLTGRSGPLSLGPVPAGTPVSLLMNMDPEKRKALPPAVLGLTRALLEIKRGQLTGDRAYAVLEREAGPALLEASKCPDMVLDRGHWFGQHLSDDDKEALIAFLKTL